jgi:hypothetical protein
MKWVNTMTMIQTTLSFPVLGSLVAQSTIIQIQKLNVAIKIRRNSDSKIMP